MSCIFRHGQHGLEIVPDSRSHYKLDQRVGLDGAEVLNCKFVVCADHWHIIHKLILYAYGADSLQ